MELMWWCVSLSPSPSPLTLHPSCPPERRPTMVMSLPQLSISQTHTQVQCTCTSSAVNLSSSSYQHHHHIHLCIFSLPTPARIPTSAAASSPAVTVLKSEWDDRVGCNCFESCLLCFCTRCILYIILCRYQVSGIISYPQTPLRAKRWQKVASPYLPNSPVLCTFTVRSPSLRRRLPQCH